MKRFAVFKVCLASTTAWVMRPMFLADIAEFVLDPFAAAGPVFVDGYAHFWGFWGG